MTTAWLGGRGKDGAATTANGALDAGDSADVWTALTDSIAAHPPTRAETPAASTAQTAFQSRGARVRGWLLFRALDLVGLVMWSYMFLKLLVFDVDRAIVTQISPALSWVVDLRGVLVLAAVALLGLFAWRGATVLALIYLAFFPFILLFYRTPRLIGRLGLHRSWTFWIVLIQVSIVSLRSFRFLFLTGTLGLLAVIAINLVSEPAVLLSGAVVLLALLGWAAARIARASLRSSWFVRSQRKLIDSLTRTTTESVLRWKRQVAARPKGDLLNQQQVEEFTTSVLTLAITNRSLYFWANKLQQYQRSNLTVLLNFAVYVSLFLVSVFAFGMANAALLKADPSQFIAAGSPSWLAMMVYGLSTLYRSEGGGIAAAGDAAFLLQLVAGLYGPLFLVTFLLSTAVTWSGSREDKELRSTVTELRSRARTQEADVRLALRVGLDEALERLRSLGFGSVQVLYEYLRRSMPADDLDEG